MDAEQRAYVFKVLASSMIGNSLEWYDFLVYVAMGGVISKLFFPSDSVYARLLAFYGVFAAGFVVRPVGALIFGRIGDKYGRRLALTLSIYVMSVPTALVGCLPTFQQVGLAAPLLLVALRLLQGLAVGGEFTSTMVFLVEAAPPHQRGLYGSAAFMSVMVGVITGSLVALAFNLGLSDDQLMLWGWRAPFLLSIAGAAVGVYIRKHLKEAPHSAGPESEKPPVRQVLAAMAVVVLIDCLTAIGFYLTVTFLPSFFQSFAGFSRKMALSINTANMVLYMLVIPLGGWLWDRHGHLWVLLGPCLIMGACSWPLYMAFGQSNAALAWASQAVMAACMAIFSGALPVTFVHLFPRGARCTGVSVAHNISMAVCGGTAPLMATALLSSTHNIASPAALVIVASALSAVGVLLVARVPYHKT